MAPFPLIKLAIVFFKQVSKPLAAQIKARAKNSEFFKKYVCMPPAQFYHWYDVNLRMRMLGIETKKVAKMNEEAAVALGADILGEGVILGVAIAGLALEYARQSKNNAIKETRQQERLVGMEQQIAELELTLANQSAQMLQLERHIQHKVSPPSKPTKSSSSTSLPVSTTNKDSKGQAFSILDTSLVQSPLMQLHRTDYLLLTMTHVIQQTNDFIMSPVKQWSSSLRKTKN
ncbi:unnamed protein product [Adineta steineri]|uniref:OPA3-like protein n=1 Tax=Adineta steineri TaxID=433720 RepID=A0A813MRM1_9BILA|nr:unnamed protein product [Adineta steineri]CAF0842122.1 unnamed protein product [Adineta steineri]CAF0843024.1 unnamed protein product [Adineta steineri]CAF0911553.1 unnamed protein product [Adineta steineri]CAF1240446.1 unnamed protein product [Adineta steineri]